jgi:crotonobetainyl-CoA:carnitine CoA-transferase CaiB-like acyl-CoA transferase
MLAEPPPTCGEHTDEVLADIGYSAKEISAFREAEIV